MYRRATVFRDPTAFVEAGELPLLGWVWVVRDAACRIMELHWDGVSGDGVPSGAREFDSTLRFALTSYEKGSDAHFPLLPLAPASTAFASRVRSAMCAIPRGRVVSYKQLAEAIGSPLSARAVGQVCARNPLPIIVPCHRVVATRGAGGFSLGARAKRLLWSIEDTTDWRCSQSSVGEVLHRGTVAGEAEWSRREC